MKALSLGSIGVVILCAGCAVDGPTAVDHESIEQPRNAMAPPLDLAGAWTWHRVEHFTFPPFAAVAIFGVEPEGRTTVAKCVSDGAMELEQDGSVLTGSDAFAASACETLGGQTFALRGGAAITGEIRGRSVRLSLQGNVLCLIHAVARDLQAGVAATLQGGGRCVIPGHPQSDVPGFEPPPAGTEVITSWTAVRDG